MSNADDQLRAALQAEASTVEPSPEGYTQIKQRIAARRRIRFWQGGALAAATALSVAAVAVVVYTGDDGKTQVGITDVTPTPDESLSEGPSSTPSASPTAVAVPASTRIEAVWPFATQGEADQWARSALPELATPETAVDSFRKVFLGTGTWTKSATRAVEPRVVEIDLLRTQEQGARPIVVTTVTLRSYGENEADGPWVVMHALQQNLDVTEPSVPASITTPVQVSGTIVGYHHAIQTEVRALDGQSLGSAHTEAGQDMPWRASIGFKKPASVDAGSVTATTRSDADGGITWFVALPVRLTTEETTSGGDTPTNFVAVKDARLALFRASDGAITRYLTAERPGGGAATPVMGPDGTTVYFVRGQGTCASDVMAISTAPGAAERTVVASHSGTHAIGNITVSGDGRKLAYVRVACADQGETVVVRDLATGKEHAWSSSASPPEQGSITDLALDQDGSKLYYLHNPCCGDDDPNLRVLDTTGPYEVLEDDSTTWAFARQGCVLQRIGVSTAYRDVVAFCATATQLEARAYAAAGSHQTLFRLPYLGRVEFAFHHPGAHMVFNVNDSDNPSAIQRWHPGSSPVTTTALAAQPAW